MYDQFIGTHDIKEIKANQINQNKLNFFLENSLKKRWLQ